MKRIANGATLCAVAVVLLAIVIMAAALTAGERILKLTHTTETEQ